MERRKREAITVKLIRRLILYFSPIYLITTSMPTFLFGASFMRTVAGDKKYINGFQTVCAAAAGEFVIFLKIDRDSIDSSRPTDIIKLVVVYENIN